MLPEVASPAPLYSIILDLNFQDYNEYRDRPLFTFHSFRFELSENTILTQSINHLHSTILDSNI